MHLAGLHLALVQGNASPYIPPLLKRLADGIATWPHFPPPPRVESPTVWDVALAEDAQAHVRTVRSWAETLWNAWGAHHDEVARLVQRYLG